MDGPVLRVELAVIVCSVYFDRTTMAPGVFDQSVKSSIVKKQKPDEVVKPIKFDLCDWELQLRACANIKPCTCDRDYEWKLPIITCDCMIVIATMIGNYYCKGLA